MEKFVNRYYLSKLNYEEIHLLPIKMSSIQNAVFLMYNLPTHA